MPNVELNGWTISYEDAGSGPPVLLAHGLLMDRTMFDPQVASLEDSYRIITPDLRGHGSSEKRDEDHTQWDMMEDHMALLDHLGVNKAVFGGVSQGGFQSLRAALKHPERVEALILIDTQAGGEDEGQSGLYEAFADFVRSDGWSEEILDTATISMFGDSATSELRSHWIARWQAQPTEGVSASMRSVTRREDISDRLGEISAPALVIHGKEDVAIDIAKAKSMAEGLAGPVEFVEIDGAGHSSTVENPEPVTAAIAAFLEKIYS